MLKKDVKSGTNYYHLKNGEELPQAIVDGIDASQPENFLIATYNNQTRFLLNNGTLVISDNPDAISVYRQVMEKVASSALFNAHELEGNLLTFYLDVNHAQMRFNCRNCENGGSHDYFYEIVNGFTKGNAPFNTLQTNWNGSTMVMDCHIPGEALSFYLSDIQAAQVYGALSEIASLSQQGKYTYVELIHNCVSLLTDVYNKAGFNQHFSNYLLPEELLVDSDVKPTALVHQKYYNEDHLHPFRFEIEKYVKSVLGENFSDRDRWHELQYKLVDIDKANAHPIMAEVIKEIYQIRKEVYPNLIADSLKVFNVDEKSAQSIAPKIASTMVDGPIFYINLFYTYVLKHELAIQNAFKDEPYAQSISPSLGANIHSYCHNYDEVGNLYYKDVCATLCEVDHLYMERNYHCKYYLTDKNVDSDFGDCFVRNLPPYEDYCRLEFSY
jgi:hypothetical protein